MSAVRVGLNTGLLQVQAVLAGVRFQTSGIRVPPYSFAPDPVSTIERESFNLKLGISCQIPVPTGYSISFNKGCD